MHDIDRTQLETEEEWESDESEFEGDEFEAVGGSEEIYGEAEPELDEVEEVELASQLLEVSDEDELEDFLGRVVRWGWTQGRRMAQTPTGPATNQKQKTVADDVLANVKRAGLSLLPSLGQAIGAGVGDTRGAKWGATLGAAAEGGLKKWLGLELELEGLSPQDQEFEIARRFVRFTCSSASNAARKAASSPAPPKVIVQRAIRLAANRHLPGAVQVLTRGPTGSMGRGGDATSGRWVRQGQSIVITV